MQMLGHRGVRQVQTDGATHRLAAAEDGFRGHGTDGCCRRVFGVKGGVVESSALLFTPIRISGAHKTTAEEQSEAGATPP